jgi:superfamily II DNA or RNA helicase
MRLISNYAWLPRAELPPPVLAKLTAALTFTPPSFGEDAAPPFKFYRETANHIGVPREYYLARKTSSAEDRFEVVEGAPWPSPLKFSASARLEPDQEDVKAQVLAHLQGHLGGIVEAATGFGKCHGRGTEVIMFDGSLRKVEDLRPGDLLMGPDSKPRTVLSTCKGVGPLFRVVPKSGESFVCNDAHVLSLRSTNRWQRNGGGSGGRWRGDEHVTVSVNDYLNRSKTFKHIHKLWRVAVDFKEQNLPLDPYMLGVILGDGHNRRVCITAMDHEIVESVHKFANSFGLRVRKEVQKNNKASMYHCVGVKGQRNPIITILRRLALFRVPCGSKFIPDIYKSSSRAQRMELLAGLIDTDGSIAPGSCEFSSKSQRLAEDAAFVARSLGLAVRITPKRVNGAIYYRLSISGDMTEIPMRIKRKRVLSPRLQKKNVLRTGFTVEPIGVGDYYGFELSGDHLYLLRDFTVTHNTVLAAAIIAALGKTALVIVHRKFLLRQWQRQLAKFLPGAQIGVIAGARCEYEGKHVVVAMVQTIARRKLSRELRRHFGLIIPDEVHRHGARSWANVMGLFHARYRLGFSATPTRPDGAEVVIQAHCGPVIVRYKKLRRPPKVRRIFTDFRLPELVKNGRFLPMTTLHKLLAEESVPGEDACYRPGSAAARTAKVAGIAVQAYKAGRKVLVFASWKVHLKLFQEAVLRVGWPRGGKPTFIWVIGGVLDEDLARAEAESCIVLATYGYAREALDLGSLDVMILLTPTAQVDQAVGRIARDHPSKKEPLIIDIQDPLVSKCVGMATKREAQYLALLGPDWNK